MSQDPRRLIEDESASPRLRELIEASRRDVATDEEMRLLQSRLAPLLWPADGAPGGADTAGATGGGSAGGTAGALKIVGALVIAGSAIGGAIWWANSDSSPAPAPSATRPTDDSREVEQTPEPIEQKRGLDERAVETAAPPEEPSGPALDPSAPTAKPSDRERPAAKANPPVTAPSPAKTAPKDVPSEAALLDRARRALKSRPQSALALIEQHRRLYPRGILVQEREVLAIEALKQLGREAEAKGRAERFQERYPGSAHQRKVDGLIKRR